MNPLVGLSHSINIVISSNISKNATFKQVPQTTKSRKREKAATYGELGPAHPAPPAPASETAAPPEAVYYLEEETEEEKESLTARAEVHWMRQAWMERSEKRC